MSKIVRNGAPTSTTPGILGQEYYDKETGKSYICTSVNYDPDDEIGEIDGTYIWEEEGGSNPYFFNSELILELTPEDFTPVYQDDGETVNYYQYKVTPKFNWANEEESIGIAFQVFGGYVNIYHNLSSAILSDMFEYASAIPGDSLYYENCDIEGDGNLDGFKIDLYAGTMGYDSSWADTYIYNGIDQDWNIADAFTIQVYGNVWFDKIWLFKNDSNLIRQELVESIPDSLNSVNRFMDRYAPSIEASIDAGDILSVEGSTVMLPVTQYNSEFGFYDNGKYIVVPSNKSGYLIHSTDGFTWEQGEPFTLDQPQFMMYGNGMYVMVCFSSICYSTDAVSWTKATLPSNARSPMGAGAYGNGVFSVAYTSTSSSLPGTALYSTDGINWISTSLPSSASRGNMIYADGKFWMVSNSATAYSVDGIVWEEVMCENPVATANYSNDITYGNGMFVRSIDSTSAAYSYDGIEWTKSDFSTNIGSCRCPVYFKDKFIIFGSSSSYVYSTNGVDWITAYMSSVNLPTIFVDDKKIIKIDSNSRYGYLYSLDGIAWTSQVYRFYMDSTDRTEDILRYIKAKM